MRIHYIDRGLAERIGDTILLHKGLKKFPYLHKQLLKHEKTHNPKKGILYNVLVDLFSLFTLFDLEYDMYYIWFIMGTPSSLNHFLAYEKDKNTIYPGLLVSYLLVLVLLYVIYPISVYYVLVFLLGIHVNNIL